jgi:hypothetical protein
VRLREPKRGSRIQVLPRSACTRRPHTRKPLSRCTQRGSRNRGISAAFALRAQLRASASGQSAASCGINSSNRESRRSGRDTPARVVTLPRAWHLAGTHGRNEKGGENGSLGMAVRQRRFNRQYLLHPCRRPRTFGRKNPPHIRTGGRCARSGEEAIADRPRQRSAFYSHRRTRHPSTATAS